MARDDAATSAAQQEILAALDGPAGAGPVPLGYGPGRLGATVVAGPPDDALHAARLEIIAALNGDPTPGGI